MLKVLIGLCFLSSLTFAESQILGPEQTKKFVKYSLWYEGVQLENQKFDYQKSLTSQYLDGKIKEELFVPLQKLDI
tara:strand:+ start:83891 stop:84118 length:228 start_codon:yes stop_codon:yes gene_type:complete